MARTDAASVGLIIEVDDSISLTPFIDTANELVTELCTGSKGPDPAYTDTRLELIERWLAAHFYAIRDMRRASEQADVVQESFQYRVDLGLDATMYGQQAKRLDTNGGLANMDEAIDKGKKIKPSVSWLGTTYT